MDFRTGGSFQAEHEERAARVYDRGLGALLPAGSRGRAHYQVARRRPLSLRRGIWTASNTRFLGPTRVHNPNGISNDPAVFAGLTIVTDRETDRLTDRQTDGQTDLATLFVEMGRIYEVLYCSLLRCGLITLFSQLWIFPKILRKDIHTGWRTMF